MYVYHIIAKNNLNKLYWMHTLSKFRQKNKEMHRYLYICLKLAIIKSFGTFTASMRTFKHRWDIKRRDQNVKCLCGFSWIGTFSGATQVVSKYLMTGYMFHQCKNMSVTC